MIQNLIRLLRIKPATRYPADPRAIFILILCVTVGLPLLFLRVKPGSLEELLPSWAVLLWGLSLILGAVVTLSGMARQTPGGIITEQVGSIITAFATLIYGVGVVGTAGSTGAWGACIVFGFGVSCFFRWLQLEALIHSQQEVVDAVRAGHDPEEFIL